MAKGRAKKAITQKAKASERSRQEFYADGLLVYCKPQVNGNNTTLGFVACTAESADDAKEIARCLNGTRTDRIVRNLLRALETGVPDEEERTELFGKDIAAAEKYLREGP